MTEPAWPASGAINQPEPVPCLSPCVPPFLRWYHEALAVLPSCGKSYNQLAICELRRHDHLGAAMEYLRGLTAAEPFAARENLISLLEKYGTTLPPDLLHACCSIGDGISS